MTETATTTEPQDAEHTSPPNDTTREQPAAATAGGEGEQFDAARAKALIDKLRPYERQARSLAKELEDAKAKLKEHEDAKLTEHEKQTQRVTELETQNQQLQAKIHELTVGHALISAAADAGALHPEAVLRLVDVTSIELDRHGNPKNLDQTVEDLKQSYPGFFKTVTPGTADGGTRPPAPAGFDMNNALRKAAGRT